MLLSEPDSTEEIVRSNTTSLREPLETLRTQGNAARMKSEIEELKKIPGAAAALPPRWRYAGTPGTDGAWVPRQSHRVGGARQHAPGGRSPRNRRRVDLRCIRSGGAPIRHHGSPATECLDLRGHHLTARRRVTHRWTTSFLGARRSTGPDPVCQMQGRRLPASGPAHHRGPKSGPAAAQKPVSASSR